MRTMKTNDGGHGNQDGNSEEVMVIIEFLIEVSQTLLWPRSHPWYSLR